MINRLLNDCLVIAADQINKKLLLKGIILNDMR